MYDLVILGGGPAGYLAAERASAEGMNVCLIEKRFLGGVCLNEGCIPTKTFLNSAQIYDHTVHGAAFGVTAVVTLAMMFISSIFPSFFLSLGRTLGVTLLLTVVIELIMYFAGFSLGIIDYVVVLIFCGYVGYDWSKANANLKTVDNAIDSAAELYVDIANLFIRILRIMARAQRN